MKKIYFVFAFLFFQCVVFAQQKNYYVQTTTKINNETVPCYIYVSGWASGDTVTWDGPSKYDRKGSWDGLGKAGYYAEGYGTRKVISRPTPKEYNLITEYTGKMKHGKRHGQGVNLWPDGRKFVGEYSYDEPWTGALYQHGKIIGVRYEGKSIDAEHWKVICSNESISDGWAIISEEKSYSCINTQIQYLIRNLTNCELGSTAIICSNSKIPNGWEKQSERECPECGCGINKQYLIEKKEGKSAVLVIDSRECGLCNGKGYYVIQEKYIKYYVDCKPGDIYAGKCPVYGYQDKQNNCSHCNGTGRY